VTKIGELKPAERVLYRVFTPLILGGGLVAVVSCLFIDPLRQTDLPSWIHVALRGVLAAFLVGFVFWLSARASEIHSWVRMDESSNRMKSLWTGRVRVRSLTDIQEVRPLLRCPGWILVFRDGLRVVFEGPIAFESSVGLTVSSLLRKTGWTDKPSLN